MRTYAWKGDCTIIGIDAIKSTRYATCAPSPHTPAHSRQSVQGHISFGMRLRVAPQRFGYAIAAVRPASLQTPRIRGEHRKLPASLYSAPQLIGLRIWCDATGDVAGTGKALSLYSF